MKKYDLRDEPDKDLRRSEPDRMTDTVTLVAVGVLLLFCILLTLSFVG